MTPHEGPSTSLPEVIGPSEFADMRPVRAKKWTCPLGARWFQWTCPPPAPGSTGHVPCESQGLDILGLCPVLACRGGHVQWVSANRTPNDVCGIPLELASPRFSFHRSGAAVSVVTNTIVETLISLGATNNWRFPVPEQPGAGEFIVYASSDGRQVVQLRAVAGTVWLSQAQLADLYGTTVPNISQLIARILADGEVTEATVNSEVNSSN